jgi:ribonuclease HI
VLISPKHNLRSEISGSEPASTNNRMELTAAIMALRTLKRQCIVDLFTDSQYLHNAFSEGWLQKWQSNGWRTAGSKPVQNADLWRDLIQLCGTHEIRWNWVRGHADTAGNRRADELAVQARCELAERLAQQQS